MSLNANTNSGVGCLDDAGKLRIPPTHRKQRGVKKPYKQFLSFGIQKKSLGNLEQADLQRLDPQPRIWFVPVSSFIVRVEPLRVAGAYGHAMSSVPLLAAKNSSVLPKRDAGGFCQRRLPRNDGNVRYRLKARAENREVIDFSQKSNPRQAGSNAACAGANILGNERELPVLAGSLTVDINTCDGILQGYREPGPPARGDRCCALHCR
jgi:hypothetical protein